MGKKNLFFQGKKSVLVTAAFNSSHMQLGFLIIQRCRVLVFLNEFAKVKTQVHTFLLFCSWNMAPWVLS